MKVENICGHSFLQEFLDPNSLVLDYGSNHGEFAAWLSTHVGCTIHGVEPDHRLFPNLPKLPKCKFHPIAISDKSGTLKLSIGKSRCSSLYYKEKTPQNIAYVKTITLQGFCELNDIQKIDLLKLDIEGAEIPVLINLDEFFLKNKISQISVEFHDHIDRAVVPKIQEIISRLKEMGFIYFPFSYFTYTDVLFVNSRFIKLTSFEIFILKAVKYKRGILRMVKRCFANAWNVR